MFWFLTLSCYVISVPSGDPGKLDLSFLVPVDGLQHLVLHQLAKVLPSVLLQDKAPKTVNSSLCAFGVRSVGQSSAVCQFYQWSQWCSPCI